MNNLELLHQGEEIVRAESLRRIAEWPDHSHHLQMIERAMDFIHQILHPVDASNKDELAVKVLSIRVFNALGVTLKLGLSGYYQAAAAQLRDVLETAFLLDLFTHDRKNIELWRTLPENDRKRRFSPVKVRQALDARDKFNTGKRAAAYDMFCRLASHPNPDSVKMLVPAGMTNAHCGPFLDPTGLQALLSEAALTALQAAQIIRILSKSKSLIHLAAKADLMENEIIWAKKFFNHEGDLEVVRRMKARIVAAQQDTQRKA